MDNSGNHIVSRNRRCGVVHLWRERIVSFLNIMDLVITQCMLGLAGGRGEVGISRNRLNKWQGCNRAWRFQRRRRVAVMKVIFLGAPSAGSARSRS